jgi:enoyl-CoA hydratase/carnithine racemase
MLFMNMRIESQGSGSGLVETETTGRIGVVRLNRPQKLNALTDAFLLELRAALVRMDDDPAVDVVILCGSGTSFCAGADVAQRQLRTEEEKIRLGGLSERGARAIEMLLRMVNWKPTIAAVHGYVLGAGFVLTMCCDIVVAAEGTKFQIKETSRGLSGFSHWWLMSQMLGAGRFADDVALTGRYFRAEEALRYGVISRVTPDGRQMEEAMNVATEICANPPIGVRDVVRIRRLRLEQASLEIDSRRPRYSPHFSKDFEESARAFVEKRPAGPFTGA